MRLGIRTETFTPGEDWSWLGSAHATDTWESITLDGDAFLATFPSGVVPGGVVVGEQANGLFTLAAAAAGKRTFHLATTKDLGGTTAATVGPTPAAGMWHGQVIVANLPTGHGLTAAKAAAMPHVHYVGTVPA